MRRFLLATAFSLISGACFAQDLLLFDASTFGDVVLSQSQSALAGVELEAQIGSYNNEFIANYGTESVFARAGRSVGRLDILTDKGHAPCTAFLLNDNRLMTNHHCVPGILDDTRFNASSIISVQFKAGYVRDGIEEGVKTFHVDPKPLETSKELDYTVLQLIGDANRDFGALELTSTAPQNLAPFWIIGHPMGEAQRISREKCQADNPALASGRLRHTCDTLPGNSGSPVLDADSKLVVALHHAGSRAGAVNFAIPMRDILAQSAILSPAAQPAPQEEPDTSAELAALAKELAKLKAERDRLLKEAQEERITVPRILQATPLDPGYWQRGLDRVPEEKQPIRDSDLSVDGKHAAVATQDVARIWSLEDARYVWTLKHEGSVYSAHFSPDGARLVTASSDKTARIWDVATGEQLVLLQGHAGWVAEARFSPDGTVIATVSGDKTVRLWDSRSGRELGKMEGHENWVVSVSFDPTGKRIVTSSTDGSARIWSTRSLKELYVKRLSKGSVLVSEFSPDGKTIASGTSDRTAFLWNVETGRVYKTVAGRGEGVDALAFSPDGRVLAVAGGRGPLHLFDLKKNATIVWLEPHQKPVNSVRFSPDGQRLILSSDDAKSHILGGGG